MATALQDGRDSHGDRGPRRGGRRGDGVREAHAPGLALCGGRRGGDGCRQGGSLRVGRASPSAASLPAAVRARRWSARSPAREPSADTIGSAARHVLEHLGGDLLEDIYASAVYRKAMAAVFVKRQ